MRNQRVACKLCGRRGSTAHKIPVVIHFLTYWLCDHCAFSVATAWQDGRGVPRSRDASRDAKAGIRP